MSESYETVICPPEQSKLLDIRELFQFRNLLWSMSRRQLKAEFGDMTLGFFWVLARPLLMTLIFVGFRKLSNVGLGVSIPYAAFLYSGLILWFFFTESVTRVASSIHRDANLIKKIYFPRLLSPLAAVSSLLFNLAVATIPLLIMLLYFNIVPGWRLMLLPVVIAQTMVLALGIGCVFAVLITLSRDWERLLKLILYIGIFLSPVIYAPDMLPHLVRSIHMLNPMSGALLGFRAAFFSDFPLAMQDWMMSLVFCTSIGLAGVYIFQRAERAFMDRI